MFFLSIWLEMFQTHRNKRHKTEVLKELADPEGFVRGPDVKSGLRPGGKGVGGAIWGAVRQGWAGAQGSSRHI